MEHKAGNDGWDSLHPLASCNASGSSGPAVRVNIRLEAFLSAEEAGGGLVSKAPGVTWPQPCRSLQHRSCILLPWGGATLDPRTVTQSAWRVRGLRPGPTLTGEERGDWLRAPLSGPSLGQGAQPCPERELQLFPWQGQASAEPVEEQPD